MVSPKRRGKEDGCMVGQRWKPEPAPGPVASPLHGSSGAKSPCRRVQLRLINARWQKNKALLSARLISVSATAQVIADFQN